MVDDTHIECDAPLDITAKARSSSAADVVAAHGEAWEELAEVIAKAL
tara:strand:- start:9980 stop:10120 length:141 start_codon:yes stop_codon:yes gene_type:complete